MDRSSIRQRVKKPSSNLLPNLLGKHQGRQHSILPMHGSHFLLYLGFLLAVLGSVFVYIQHLPAPLMISDEANHPNKFIAERAHNFLVGLTSIGPRVTGSYENEVLAVDYIKQEVGKIMKTAKSVHDVQLDVQKISGSFPLTFLDGMTQVYENVQNVIVKVGPRSGSNHSVLMNCHFDTVQDSPGGTDDGASCAIMIEILRLVTLLDTPLKHNIVLLFNGAEENFMEASHGFITAHKWAKDIRVVVNLESCGAGGREVMFQSGPNHPWLIKIYSETVGYPFASSVAQEIFQSGLVPGDTDFRIFRDFGGVPGLRRKYKLQSNLELTLPKKLREKSVKSGKALYAGNFTLPLVKKSKEPEKKRVLYPGMDFAWYLNGYVYHTKDDSVAHVPMGSIQRTGENMHNLVVGLANSEELSETAKHKDGSVVFFDVLGAFMMLWSVTFSKVIALSTVALSVYSVYSNMIEATSRGMTRREYLKQLASSAGFIVLFWIIGMLFAVGLALALTAVGGAMSWYSQPAWIIVLYGIPALLLPSLFLYLRSKYQREVVTSPWTLFQLYYDANLIIWTSMVALCIVFGVMSVVLPLLWTFHPALNNIIRLRVFKHWRDGRWLPLYAAGMFLPWLQCTYVILSTIQLIVPIMGRCGAANNAEIIIAVITSAMLILHLGYMVPLILLVRNPRQVINILGLIFGIGLFLIVFTPLGFPYSGNPSSLSPQRYVILHTERSFFAEGGALESEESGYWIVDLDVNSPYTVRGIVPEVDRAVPVVEDCENRLYCGMPYFIPIISFIWKTHWIPGPQPSIPQNTTLQLLSKNDVTPYIQRLVFKVTGPDHMGLIICPETGVELDGWSLLEGEPLAGPQWHGRKTYFVYYSYAADPKPWIFHLDFKIQPGYKGKVVDLALTSHFVHGKHQKSKELVDLFKKFPDWTTTTGWQATYKSFVY